MNWKAWFQGFAAAAIGGAATSVTKILTAPGAVQPKQVVIDAGIGGLLTGLAYLAKSPFTAEGGVPPKD